MPLKNTIHIAVFVLTITFSISLIANGRSPFPAIFLGLLVFFLIYCFRNIPKKHKTFSYLDQQRAMRAFDRTDSLKFALKDKRKKKKRRL